MRYLATNPGHSALGVASTDLCKMPYIFKGDEIAVSVKRDVTRYACPPLDILSVKYKLDDIHKEKTQHKPACYNNPKKRKQGAAPMQGSAKTHS